MKISRIKVESVLGMKSVSIDLQAPVLMFAGSNFAGKSSLLQAIRMAFTNVPERVALKKDFPQLVTEGAKEGFVSVWADGQSIAGLSLPSGNWVEEFPPEISVPKLQFVLSPERFAAAGADERRTFLFDITGIQVSGAIVRERLAAKGAAQAHVDAIMPMLRSGFPEAVKDAKRRATEARGAWKAITGEAYGDKKAEAWRAAKPEADAGLVPELETSLESTERALSNAQQDLGQMKAQHSNHLQQTGKAERLRQQVDTRSRVEAKLAKDLEEVQTWQAKVGHIRDARLSQDALPCPDCGSLLVHKDHALVQAAPLAAGTEGDIGKLADYEAALASFERAVANDRRDLAAIESAEVQLQEIADIDATQFDANAMEKQKAKVDGLQEERKTLSGQLMDVRQRLEKAALADKATADAAKHHADVQAWGMITDALSPDGIPGELLQEAITPFNDLLHELSQFANWKRVQVGADMGITASGRPYSLLSESEQWRCDTILALAIAQLSGVRFVMLDRFDVLDLEGRADLLDLLDECLATGAIDSAIVAGTMKSAPADLGPNFQSVWLENGRAALAAQEQAA